MSLSRESADLRFKLWDSTVSSEPDLGISGAFITKNLFLQWQLPKRPGEQWKFQASLLPSVLSSTFLLPGPVQTEMNCQKRNHPCLSHPSITSRIRKSKCENSFISATCRRVLKHTALLSTEDASHTPKDAWNWLVLKPTQPTFHFYVGSNNICSMNWLCSIRDEQHVCACLHVVCVCMYVHTHAHINT